MIFVTDDNTAKVPENTIAIKSNPEGTGTRTIYLSNFDHRKSSIVRTRKFN